MKPNLFFCPLISEHFNMEAHTVPGYQDQQSIIRNKDAGILGKLFFKSIFFCMEN